MLMASGALTLLAGALIGATGIGGVLLVPTLTQFEGMPLRAAVATASLAFAFPGVAALWWLRLAAPTTRAGLLPLVAGALTGAWLGGQWVQTLEARWLLGAVAVLALFSGLRGLLQRTPAAHPKAVDLGAVVMVALGLGVGAASALTGTGGPVVLIPLLLALRQPMARTIAAAQVVQLPVALSASSVHLASDALTPGLALAVGTVLLVGSLLGQQLARGVDMRKLQRLVGLLLLGTGLWLGAKFMSL